MALARWTPELRHSPVSHTQQEGQLAWHFLAGSPPFPPILGHASSLGQKLLEALSPGYRLHVFLRPALLTSLALNCFLLVFFLNVEALRVGSSSGGGGGIPMGSETSHEPVRAAKQPSCPRGCRKERPSLLPSGPASLITLQGPTWEASAFRAPGSQGSEHLSTCAQEPGCSGLGHNSWASPRLHA